MKYEHVLWVPEIFLGALLECTLWMVHLWMRLMLKEVNFLEGVTNSGEWAAVGRLTLKEAEFFEWVTRHGGNLTPWHKKLDDGFQRHPVGLS